jgi:hypothetical protein
VERLKSLRRASAKYVDLCNFFCLFWSVEEAMPLIMEAFHDPQTIRYFRNSAGSVGALQDPHFRRKAA